MGDLMPFWKKKAASNIWKAKSVVNFYLKKLEVTKNILNPTDRGYNKEKTYTLNVCRRSFI